MIKKTLLTTYFKIYKFISRAENENQDLSKRYIHSHLVCVLSTGFLMWAYAILAYFSIASPVPWIVGLIASLVHFFSPLLYRINKNKFFNTNVFLGAGIIHQATFAYYIGGFHSNIIIWFGILPMLAGVVCGRKGIITWVIICSFVTFYFLYLEATGFVFPMLITPFGLLLSQALVTFGWIYASAVIIWFFLLWIEIHENEIDTKNTGIQNLICVITHDISNGLAVILGRTTILNKAELSDKNAESLNKIFLAASNMKDIVNSVKNLYAVEIGKKKIEFEQVDFAKLLFSLKENFSDLLDAKNINLVLDYNESESYIIRGNLDILLHQVLGNLLSNAIKFSSKNSEIKIRLEKKQGKVSICIKDSGIGISKELMLNLFDMRVNTNRQGTEGESGTGFGLPIVKTFVEKLNGKILVSSNEHGEVLERGTTFTLIF